MSIPDHIVKQIKALAEGIPEADYKPPTIPVPLGTTVIGTANLEVQRLAVLYRILVQESDALAALQIPKSGPNELEKRPGVDAEIQFNAVKLNAVYTLFFQALRAQFPEVPDKEIGVFADWQVVAKTPPRAFECVGSGPDGTIIWR